jgi:hypothetical protein
LNGATDENDENIDCCPVGAPVYSANTILIKKSSSENMVLLLLRPANSFPFFLPPVLVCDSFLIKLSFSNEICGSFDCDCLIGVAQDGVD